MNRLALFCAFLPPTIAIADTVTLQPTTVHFTEGTQYTTFTMSELIPFTLDRLNRGLTLGNWLLGSQSSSAGMQKSIRYYMRRNVFITTSGVFDQVALNCAIAR